MINEIFVLSLALLSALILQWGFRKLPKEKWQILASMPKERGENGEWQGINFTYYGFFIACSSMFAVAILFVLLSALSVPVFATFIIVFVVMAACVPSAKIIARIVEKKSHTFTTGGASFVGIIITPWVIWCVNMTLGHQMGFEVPVLSTLAVFSIAYAFGEGFGRLGCISFGCCYGKPLCDCSPHFQKIFDKRSFTFSGKTKKIAYAHGLDGEKVLPIQAITAVIYCTSAVLGVYLFLNGFYFSAFVETLMITQIWRLVSEFFRADYRGEGKISAYQIMGGLAVLYAPMVLLLFPGSPSMSQPDILEGLKCLWHPGVILFLQCVWVGIFLFNGRSRVTGSSLSFHVIRERC